MPGGLHADISLPHTQEWELYHNALSLCSKKARLCLAELGIDYRGHHIDLIETGSYENIGRRFLAVNPAGLVPVLVHRGHPVYESHEQIAYAAAHAGSGVTLVPEDLAARARMQRWVDKASLTGDDPTADLDSSAGNCIPGLTVPLFAAMLADIPYRRIAEGLLFHRLKQRPLMFLMMKAAGLRRIATIGIAATVIRASRDRMHGHLDELEAELAASGGPWILGDRYSLADVSWTVIIERLDEAVWLDLFLDGRRPRVAAWWKAVRARPSHAAAIGGFGHPTIARGRARIVAARRDVPALAALYEGTT
jgi:glutathione S-transferase